MRSRSSARRSDWGTKVDEPEHEVLLGLKLLSRVFSVLLDLSKLAGQALAAPLGVKVELVVLLGVLGPRLLGAPLAARSLYVARLLALGDLDGRLFDNDGHGEPVAHDGNFKVAVDARLAPALRGLG